MRTKFETVSQAVSCDDIRRHTVEYDERFEIVDGMFPVMKEQVTPRAIEIEPADPKNIHIDWIPYACDVEHRANVLKVKQEFDYTISSVDDIANPMGQLDVEPKIADSIVDGEPTIHNYPLIPYGYKIGATPGPRRVKYPYRHHEGHRPLEWIGGHIGKGNDNTKPKWSNRGNSFGKRQEMTWENPGRDEFFNGCEADYQISYEPDPLHIENGLHWYLPSEGEYEPSSWKTIAVYSKPQVRPAWTLRKLEPGTALTEFQSETMEWATYKTVMVPGRWRPNISQQRVRRVYLDLNGKVYPLNPNPTKRLWSRDKNAPNLESAKVLKHMALWLFSRGCEFVGKLWKGEPAGKWPVKPWEYQPQYRALVGDNMNRFNVREYTPEVELGWGQSDDMYVDGVSLR